VLLTTHHLEEAEQRCDRIVVVDHGKVIAQGTLTELIASTIGSDRRTTVRLARPLPPHATDTIMACWPAPTGGASPHDDACVLRTQITSIADDLPLLLESIARFGGEVLDVEVQAPNLQSVFLHLTGRELRE
jgi:ABC-2 type transport system ATP-binding protein